MLKKSIALGTIVVVALISMFSLRPLSDSYNDKDLNAFSIDNALQHINQIANSPHHASHPNHEAVKNYILSYLNKLGLETQIQEGFSHNPKWKSVVYNKNILVRIKGTSNTKALMLLSHYDSNPHSAPGASDAAVGVATILEGLRAYLHQEKKPKNDIIILLTDNEELGLNGAHLFVKNHPWARDIGVILNFEARGTTGPSYMLMETNGGNQNLLNGFIEANPRYPVANSLAYSIYKMLPNDTDLTPFRAIGNIDGFNFAFIDNHFHYHTALDNVDNVDPKAIKHQGTYLMPLLNYFSEVDLSVLKSENNDVYINLPFIKMVHYSYLWITPMWILACLIFVFLFLFGLYKRRIVFKQVCLGFIPLFLVVTSNFILGYYGWKIIQYVYPQYQEILHNFPYNGHDYIWGFVLLATLICYIIYNYFFKIGNTASLLIAPIFLWLMLNGLIAFELKGASFLILPVYFALIILALLISFKKIRIELTTVLTIPMIVIMFPFLKMFPVGLGLNNIVASTILVSLMFCLSLGWLYYYKKRNAITAILGILCAVLFISAHAKSNFNVERPKPNSLVYFYNSDTDKAYWMSYDKMLDGWNSPFFIKEKTVSIDETGIKTPGSKYNTRFCYAAKANIKPLKPLFFEKLNDTIIGNDKRVTCMIAPQRKTDKMDIFIDSNQPITAIKANGVSIEPKAFKANMPQKLLSFYVADNNAIELVIDYNKNDNASLIIFEIANDIFSNDLFKINERPAHMIPKPFVTNDASIIKKTFKIE
ncbi:MAG: M28 family peptidase [Flavobacteriaceae bacterium]